jgi:nucleoside-diphosphate kinase
MKGAAVLEEKKFVFRDVYTRFFKLGLNVEREIVTEWALAKGNILKQGELGYKRPFPTYSEFKVFKKGEKSNVRYELEHPTLKIELKNLQIFEKRMTPHDLMYLCENGLEKLANSFVKNCFQRKQLLLDEATKKKEIADKEAKLEEERKAAYGERTFIMVKPDGVKRGKIGEVVKKFEKRGLRLVDMKLCRPPENKFAEHYAEHVGKPFYQGLLDYMNIGPVCQMVFEGLNAVAISRQMIGKTRPHESDSGTIRGDLGIVMRRNIIHGSDAVESAKREISVWFGDSKIVYGEEAKEQEETKQSEVNKPEDTTQQQKPTIKATAPAEQTKEPKPEPEKKQEEPKINLLQPRTFEEEHFDTDSEHQSVYPEPAPEPAIESPKQEQTPPPPNPTKERTFIMIKPDGVKRALIGQIVKKFEQRKLRLLDMRLCKPDTTKFAQHYAEHIGKPFYQGLLDYMDIGPVCQMVFEGLNAVNITRQMIGKTRPHESDSGTVRGDFGLVMRRNIIHGSDSVESAEREIGVWFGDSRLVYGEEDDEFEQELKRLREGIKKDEEEEKEMNGNPLIIGGGAEESEKKIEGDDGFEEIDTVKDVEAQMTKVQNVFDKLKNQEELTVAKLKEELKNGGLSDEDVERIANGFIPNDSGNISLVKLNQLLLEQTKFEEIDTVKDVEAQMTKVQKVLNSLNNDQQLTVDELKEKLRSGGLSDKDTNRIADGFLPNESGKISIDQFKTLLKQ